MPTKRSSFRDSPLVARALTLTAVIGLVALSYGVNAATANGTASATVLAQISPQPIAIFSPVPGRADALQASQLVALASPIRLGFSIDQPSRMSGSASGASSLAGEGSSFGMTMIDVDASGVARFSVAGAGATSGYIVQFPASTDGLVSRFPSAAKACSENATSDAAQGCQGLSLIVPAEALRGGGRLAVEISQSLSNLIAGELSVQVNYN
jgi:hypothetical protein